MSFSSFLSIARNKWYVIAIAIIGGLLLAGIVTLFTPSLYSASTSLYISAQTTGDNATLAYQGSLLSEQRVASYSQLAASTRVGNDVANRLNLGESGTEVAREITVTAQPNTVLLTISVEDRSPARAAAITNQAAASFTSLVAELEQPVDRTKSRAVVARVVEPAVENDERVSPIPALNLGLGLLIGIVAGLTAAILTERLDRSIRETEELERFTGLPTLGSVSFDKELSRGDKFAFRENVSKNREEYRKISTNLRFVSVDRELRSVLITSANASEGKSTAVCNLAASLSNAGSRVLIVEADLRRPKLAEYLNSEESVGLTTVLTDRAGLQTCIQHVSSINADLLASGPRPPNPTELLASTRMAKVMIELGRLYDVVLLDGPPLLPVADAVALSANCDGTILVCRRGTTNRDDVEKAARSLTQTSSNAIGTILSFVPHDRRRDYYYYGNESRTVERIAGSPAGASSASKSSAGAEIESSVRPSPRRR